MAPTIYKVTETATRRKNLRKPAVEKMRRDRINTCIEQLKVLLKTEIQASQPCSKLEKADILEIAVIHLQKSMRTNDCADAQSYADGFSRCLQETARFLSVHNQLQTTKFTLMGHSNSSVQTKKSAKVASASAHKDVSKRAGENALWRPW